MGSCSSQSRQKVQTIESVVIKQKQEITPKTVENQAVFDFLRNSPAHSPGIMKHYFAAEGIFPSQSEEPFAEKPVSLKGSSAGDWFHESKIAVTCRKGLKDSVNQDNFFILSKPPHFLAGVFDGHGTHGHVVSSLARKLLLQNMLNEENLKLGHIFAIQEAYKKTQQEIIEKCRNNKVDISFSGCTSTVIFITDQKLYISHLGDSRAILCKRHLNKLTPIAMTINHKPSDLNEKERIERSGGLVLKSTKGEQERVYPPDRRDYGLPVTRAFGDTLLSQFGVISEPCISEHQTDNDSEFAVICSDSVWEYISDEEIADIVEKYNTEHLSNTIANLAWCRWIEKSEDIVDDITVMIIPL